MTAWLEEAGHLLRLARRDHQTFCILADSGRAALAPICFVVIGQALRNQGSPAHSDGAA